MDLLYYFVCDFNRSQKMRFYHFLTSYISKSYFYVSIFECPGYLKKLLISKVVRNDSK